ncbi:unnamed protein product [Rotaria socialis]|uniref:Innexin n=1 Tax=Rotaria socialis TaxID=392032 RepID=A0A818GI12_9BILA|nr:unnamed protein product [Rotaria socialis]CAF3489657.1 unnamed protein product [Rotaria socialis]CAF4161372.1 unnamed protein product [Rotaria socialis]CAF4321585.1 unnamed protein product [Rotaria socialis]
MEWATNLISEIYKYLSHRDDTAIDRLNRLYTVTLLSAFVTLISSQQYIVGGRIICWTPQEFTKAHNTYSDDICWLGHRNYYVPENVTILDSPSTPRTYPFLIYPWLPIILIAMTVSFILPYLLVWHGLSARFGIDIKRLIQLDDPIASSRSIHFVLSQNYSIKNHRRCYVISIYLLMKFSYIIILFGQLILINRLLTGEYFIIDIQQIFNILSVKYNMWSSAHIPIETMCDFMVRMLGQNNNWYTVQCILPFNLFTKRIFALLAIWFIILFILNIIDFVYIWLWKRLWLSSHRYDYVFNFFDLYEIYLDNKKDDHRLRLATTNSRILRQEFVYKYLNIDGYLLLKLLHENSSDIKMSYLVANLFKQFSQEKNQQYQIIQRHDSSTDV